MRILDRYTTKSVFLPFLYCLATFIFLYIIIDLFGHLDEILKNKVAVEILLDYYLSFIPIIFIQTTPIAILLATAYAFGLMNKHNEITAMRSSGISVLKILRPFLFIGILMSLAIMLINETIVPTATMTTKIIKQNNIENQGPKGKGKNLINDMAIYGKQNRLTYAKGFDPLRKKLDEIIILEHDNFNNLTSKVVAKSGRWEKGKWKFYNCIVYNLNTDGDIVGKPLFYPQRVMDISESPRDFYRGQFQAENLNFMDLSEYIKRLSEVDEKVARRISVDLYYKTSFPFITFVVVLIGAAFGLWTRRGGALWSIGMSVAISFSYYTAMAVSLALGKGGWLHPLAASWGANIIFLSVGIVLLVKLTR